MKDGRGRILIMRSFRKRDLSKSTVEVVVQILSNISKTKGGEAADKKAEELIALMDTDISNQALHQKLEKMMQELLRSHG